MLNQHSMVCGVHITIDRYKVSNSSLLLFCFFPYKKPQTCGTCHPPQCSIILVVVTVQQVACLNNPLGGKFIHSVSQSVDIHHPCATKQHHFKCRSFWCINAMISLKATQLLMVPPVVPIIQHLHTPPDTLDAMTIWQQNQKRQT